MGNVWQLAEKCMMTSRCTSEFYGLQNALHVHYKISDISLHTSGCPWPKATVKPPVWNPGPKIEIPHPENHVLKVFRFRSWKPRVWKSRPQSWDPKSWKPCPENHILKFPRPQSWDPKFWKPCPENRILKFPRSFCLAALPCLSDRQKL